MPRGNGTDAGNYNQPAQIQSPAPRMDNGQGGNASAGQWNTVRSPYIRLQNGKFGRGMSRSFQYGQLYPTANHWADMRYAHGLTVDASMILMVNGSIVNGLMVNGRRFEILGAIDIDFEHVTTVLALIELQAKGSK